MTTHTNNGFTGKITRFIMSGALLAVVAVGISAMDSGQIANNRLPSRDALKLSAPIGDEGDQNIRDMPVVLPR